MANTLTFLNDDNDVVMTSFIIKEGGGEGFPKAPGLNRVKYEVRIHPLKLISYLCWEKTMNVDHLGQVPES